MLKILDQQLSKTNYLVGMILHWLIFLLDVGLIDAVTLKLTCLNIKVSNWAKRLYERKAFQSAVVAAPIPPN